MRIANVLPMVALWCLVGTAQAELVASGVDLAENTWQASSQRMFASSNGAFYEIKKTASGWSKTELSYQFKDGHSGSCYFLGITEYAGMVYTVCTENALNPLAQKHLFGFGADENVPDLFELGEIKNVALPNGMTVDASGNLYIADSGLPLLPGSIQKIPLNGAFTIGPQSTFHSFAACKPNGLHFSKGNLYVSIDPFSYVGMSQLLRYDLTGSGLTNKAILFTSWSFLDDFALVSGGPSSASLATAPTFGPGSLVVTERGNGNIVRMVNSWGLAPR